MYKCYIILFSSLFFFLKRDDTLFFEKEDFLAMGFLKVWAPKAQRADVLIEDTSISMYKGPNSWWKVETSLAEHGSDYYFLLDNGQPFPDPRSQWQPKGVHGPSRIIDHNRFSWNDHSWQPPPLSSGVIYEMHVGTFSPEGTFEGAIKYLDHLVDLGITHLELMPVNGFSGTRGWGYDGVNLFAPHEAYGGPEGLKRLVDACHSRKLAVILDVVYNHFGPEGNYLENFAPYLTERYVSPWGKAVNFDGQESDEVRRFFCDNALMWLRDYHFDGLRIDAIHAIVDTSAIHFLEQLSTEVEALETKLGRHLALIAESDLNDPKVIRSREAQGYGLDSQWNDDFHHAVHTVLTTEQNGYYADFGSLSHLAKALTSAFVYDGCYSIHRRRSHGRPNQNLPGHRFLGYIQNHDQIGNRAKGERLSQLVDHNKLRIGAGLLFTSPFVPMLFQGEEWGASTPFQYFTDHQDPDLGEAVRKGRCAEFSSFGWEPDDIPNPQDKKTYEQSKLRWDELDLEPHFSILNWYRKLIWLRRNVSELSTGRLDQVRVKYDQKAQWLIIIRSTTAVIINFLNQGQWINLEHISARQTLLSSKKGIIIKSEQAFIPSGCIVILARNQHP